MKNELSYESTKLIQERINLRFIVETLECQMIQVFRHIENKPSSVFNTFQKKVRRTNMDFFLKEPMLVKKRKEGEEV